MYFLLPPFLLFFSQAGQIRAKQLQDNSGRKKLYPSTGMVVVVAVGCGFDISMGWEAEVVGMVLQSQLLSVGN